MKQPAASAKFALALALTACDEQKTAAPEAPASTLPPLTTSTGLGHPENDAKVVALARAAMRCEWKPSAGMVELDGDCAARQAWESSQLIQDGKNEVTLLNMVEDSDDAARWLAATALDGIGAGWPRDAAAGKRLIAAAKKETNEYVGFHLGRLVGRIYGDKTGLTSAIAEVISKASAVKQQKVRQGVASSVLSWNKDQKTHDAMAALARDPKAQPELRHDVMRMFWPPTGERQEWTCKLWMDLTSDGDRRIADLGIELVAKSAGCSPRWDGLLGTMEKRVAGDAATPSITLALEKLIAQEKVSAKQKARATKLQRSISPAE